MQSKEGITRTPKWKVTGITEPEFSKPIYDDCAYKQYISQSKGPGMYHLNDRVSKQNCFVEFPGYLVTNNYGAEYVDAESELRRLNYKNSKCPEARYNPTVNNKQYQKVNSIRCSKQMVPEYTREKKACNDITSININRFEPLCYDVQKPERIQSNDYIGMQTRTAMKDITHQITKQIKKGF